MDELIANVHKYEGESYIIKYNDLMKILYKYKPISKNYDPNSESIICSLCATCNPEIYYEYTELCFYMCQTCKQKIIESSIKYEKELMSVYQKPFEENSMQQSGFSFTEIVQNEQKPLDEPQIEPMQPPREENNKQQSGFSFTEIVQNEQKPLDKNQMETMQRPFKKPQLESFDMLDMEVTLMQQTMYNLDQYDDDIIRKKVYLDTPRSRSRYDNVQSLMEQDMFQSYRCVRCSIM
jgi:hypothetical protein